MEKYLPTGVISEFIAAFLGIALVVCWRLVNKYLPPPNQPTNNVGEEIAEAKSAAHRALNQPQPESNEDGE